MTIGLALFFAMLDDLYLAEALIYDTIDAIENIDFNSITQIAIRVQIYTTSYNIICISGIFAIKFSFLFFFRNILSRIRPLTIWWRCVTVYVAVAWAFSVGFSVYGCPYVDERASTWIRERLLLHKLTGYSQLRPGRRVVESSRRQHCAHRI